MSLSELQLQLLHGSELPQSQRLWLVHTFSTLLIHCKVDGIVSSLCTIIIGGRLIITDFVLISSSSLSISFIYLVSALLHPLSAQQLYSRYGCRMRSVTFWIAAPIAAWLWTSSEPEIVVGPHKVLYNDQLTTSLRIQGFFFTPYRCFIPDECITAPMKHARSLFTVRVAMRRNHFPTYSSNCCRLLTPSEPRIVVGPYI